MITIERVGAENALIFKATRLRALQDAPLAFGSTYAKESQSSDAEWIERATRWSDGERSLVFLAMDGEEACGIAGAFFVAEDAKQAQLFSMWTAPTHRRHGIGQRLVEEVIGWARSRGAEVLRLNVTSINEGAISFYERMGFAMTGRKEPYTNDPALMEYKMSRPIRL
jgi:ribosomal protein S18 acetylase RimI-like enzyme